MAPDDYFWLFTLHDPEAGLGVDMLRALDRNPIINQTCDRQSQVKSTDRKITRFVHYSMSLPHALANKIRWVAFQVRSPLSARPIDRSHLM